MSLEMIVCARPRAWKDGAEACSETEYFHGILPVSYSLAYSRPFYDNPVLLTVPLHSMYEKIPCQQAYLQDRAKHRRMLEACLKLALAA